jgi:hypothetical protein
MARLAADPGEALGPNAKTSMLVYLQGYNDENLSSSLYCFFFHGCAWFIGARLGWRKQG